MYVFSLFSAALTKTYLITEQMETLKAYQSFSNQNQNNQNKNGSSNSSNNGATSLVNGSQKQQLTNKKGNVGQNSRFLFDVDEEDDEEDEDYVDDTYPSYQVGGHVHNPDESNAKRARRQQLARTNQHMTRNRAANDPSLTRTSSSIFNIPTLSRVHVLLQTIDSARRERDRVFREYVAARQQQQQQQQDGDLLSENLSSPATSHLPTSASSGNGNGNRGFLTSISAEGESMLWKLDDDITTTSVE
jgi:hypothetical protein